MDGESDNFSCEGAHDDDEYYQGFGVILTKNMQLHMMHMWTSFHCKHRLAKILVVELATSSIWKSTDWIPDNCSAGSIITHRRRFSNHFYLPSRLERHDHDARNLDKWYMLQWEYSSFLGFRDLMMIVLPQPVHHGCDLLRSIPAFPKHFSCIRCPGHNSASQSPLGCSWLFLAASRWHDALKWLGSLPLHRRSNTPSQTDDGS